MPIYKNESGETMTQELLQEAAEMSGMTIDQYASSLGYKLVDEEEETVIDPGKEMGAATQGASVGPLRPEYQEQAQALDGSGWNLENILSDSQNQVSAELDTPTGETDEKGGWHTMDSKLETARAALNAIKISSEQVGEIEAQADKPIEIVERELEYNAKLDKMLPTGPIINTTYEDAYKDYIQQAKVSLAQSSNNEYDIYNVPEDQWREKARGMYIDEKKAAEMRRQSEEVLEQYEKDVFGSWFSFARIKKLASKVGSVPTLTDEEIEYTAGRAILTAELKEKGKEANAEFSSTVDKITTYANIMQTTSVELNDLEFKFNNDPGSITEMDKLRYTELANTQTTAGEIYGTLFNKLGELEGASDKVNILADMTRRTYNNLDVATNRISGAAIRTLAGLGSVAHELSPQQLIKRTTGYDVNEDEGYLPYFLKAVNPGGMLAGTDTFKEGVDALYGQVEEIENATKNRQALGEIQSVEDFGEFMLDLFSEQAVNTAITVGTGGAGLIAVSAAAGGNKFNEMDLEMEHDPDLKISAFQFYGAGIFYGAAEYVTEKVSLGQAKRGLDYLKFGKNNFKKAAKGAKTFDVGEGFTLDTFSKRKALLDYGINVNKEGGAEFAAQLINNATDRWLLDKDVALTSGLGEAYLTGSIMSGLGFQAPILAGDIYRSFNSDSEISRLNDRSKRLLAIRKQRDIITKNMPKTGDANAENTLNLLQEEADNLIVENLKSKKLNEDRISELSRNDKRVLLDIDAETYKLKRGIDKLNENPNLEMDQKRNLIGKVQSQIMMANQLKNTIIANSTNSKAVEKQNRQQMQYAAEKDLNFKAINVTTQEQAYEEAAVELDNKIAEIKESGELSEAQKKQIEGIKAVKVAVKEATDNGKSAGMMFGAEVGIPIAISVGETLAAAGLGATILHETAHATLFKKLFEGDADIIGLVSSFESYMTTNFKGAQAKFDAVDAKYPLGEGPDKFSAAEIAEEKLATMLEYTYNVDMSKDRTFSKKVVDQFRKIVPKSEVTTIENGQDVFRALQSFSRGFDKGEITGLADKVLKGNVKAAQTEAKKQAKQSKVTPSLTSAKENLGKIEAKDLKGVGAQTDIAMELPGMALAQVLGRFNLSPQVAADMRDAVVEKIYLAQETTKWDGRGQLYGFINGRIALRIKDIVKEEYNRPAEERLFLSSVEGLQAEDQKGLTTPDPTPTKTAEKPKYRKIKDSNVVSNETVGKIKAKIVSAARVLKSKLDAKVSLNKTVTPLIAEIKKTMGKQADIDIKTAMGGKKNGQLQKYLLKNKKAILENMTTTWLMQAMPGAVQKQVDGKFTTEWQGKKIDRESVETDKAGRTAGSELVRRLPNAAENLSDEAFLSYVLDDVKVDAEGNITSGNPTRGKKESLAKAMAEEISLELFEDALNDPDSDITKAFERNQGALGVALVDNYISDVTRQVERGNVKFSLAGMTPVQNELFQQKEYKDKLNQWIQNRDGNIGKNYKGLLSGLKEAYAGVEGLDSKLVPIAKSLFNVMKPYLKDQGQTALPRSGATVSAILEASYDSIDFSETIVQITGATMTVAKAFEDPALIEEAKEAVLKSFKGLSPEIVLSFISSTFANSGKVGRFKNGVKGGGASRADLWQTADEAVAALKEAYPDTNWDEVSRDFPATAQVNKGHLGKLDTAKEISKSDAAWDMTTALIKQLNNVEDPNVRAIIMASMNSGTNTVLRVAAPAVWRSSVLPYSDIQKPKMENGKVVKNKKGEIVYEKTYRYEHAVPARVVMALLYDRYVNKNTDVDVDALKSDYVVAIIPMEMDDIITEVGFSKMMLAGYVPGKSPKFQRYYNLLTRGKVQYAIESQIDGELIGEGFADYYNQADKITIKESRVTGLSEVETQQKAINLANTIKFSQTPKKIRVFDFDDTLARTKSNVLYTMPDGTTGKIDAATFAKDAGKMEAEGAQWDFSEFSKVMNGTKGPLFEVAKIIADKRGTEDVFVLTARPADAAGPIQEFLSELGLSIPLANITGLGNGTPKAKADWIIGKVSEGYNDFYFADDHTGNVKAVKDALNTFDVKGKVQLAKIKFSNTLDKNFNDMIERTTGIESVKQFSDIVAKRRGAKAGRFKIWMPSSLDDFKGLTSYTFAGKGRQGDADQKFFQDALINPYFKAVRAIETARQTFKDDFKGLNKMFKPVVKKLGKLTPDGDYTYDQAIRVSLWTKAGYDIPGLPKRDLAKLNKIVMEDADLSAYADGLLLMSKTDKWSEPGEHWNAQTILSDLNSLTEKKGRKEYLAEFIENAGIIFSPQNLNKIEAIYGTKHRNALEDILYRMENGTNRPSGSNKTVNRWNNWVNNSIGSIMFFNRRSAVLQTLSTANFINWSDNNPVKAGLAFANQPQYWKDFAMIFNSAMLKQRRSGLKGDVNEAEIANAVKGSKDKATAALSYLLKKGFLPTQMVDSFAIASGGATFYRNRVNSLMKKGMSKAEAEAQAFEDFSQISEETQQSGDPALISSDQASPLGRLILAFQNTPIQLNRSIKKSFQDLYNRRRKPGQTQLQSDMGNVSKMVYYGAIQNLIFSALQSALFALIPGFDDEDDDLTEEEQKLKYGKVVSTKQSRIINSMVDTTLKGGFGLPGAVVSTLKNIYQEYEKQDAKGFMADHTYTVLTAANISPPIGSKLRKMYGGIQTKKFEKDVIEKRGWDVTIDGKFNLSPSYSVLGSEVEAFTNIPLERMVREIQGITEAMDSRNSAGQRIALSLGWKTYDVGAANEEHELIKTGAKKQRKIEGNEKSKETRAKNRIEKNKKKAKAEKDYWEEYYRKLDSTLAASKKLK
jgi:hypothetical protein